MTPFIERFALRVALSVSALVPTAAGAQPASPQQVFDRYVAHVNAGDMTAITALISENVERSDYVRCTAAMSNKACLVAYIDQTVVSVEGRIKTLKSEVRGDTVHALLEVQSKTARGFGLERIVGTDIVRVQGGLITAFRFVPEFADEQTATFFGRLGIGPRAAKPAKPANAP
jgi:hypothetical protein